MGLFHIIYGSSYKMLIFPLGFVVVYGNNIVLGTNITAINPAPSSHIPMGQNFLFLVFEKKI